MKKALAVFRGEGTGARGWCVDSKWICHREAFLRQDRQVAVSL